MQRYFMSAYLLFFSSMCIFCIKLIFSGEHTFFSITKSIMEQMKNELGIGLKYEQEVKHHEKVKYHIQYTAI